MANSTNKTTLVAVEKILCGSRPSSEAFEADLIDGSPEASTWLLYAWTCDSLTDSRSAIESALALEPDNKLALAAQTWLEGIQDTAELIRDAAQEAERLELEAAEEAARLEQEKAEAEAAEAKRLEQEKAEAAEERQRLEAEAAEAVRLEQEKIDTERLEQAQAEARRLQQELEEAEAQERQAAEEAEAQERRAAEEAQAVSEMETESENPSVVEAEICEEVQTLTEEVQQVTAVAEEVTQEDNKILVLTVDDSPTIRKLVSMTLTREGYEVITAVDGVEALTMLSERRPDIILSDINMPRLDGYKLCKFVKKHKRTKSIPVIMLSGKDGVFDKLRGRMSGCDGYITKPFESNDLLEKVNSFTKVGV